MIIRTGRDFDDFRALIYENILEPIIDNSTYYSSLFVIAQDGYLMQTTVRLSSELVSVLAEITIQ